MVTRRRGPVDEPGRAPGDAGLTVAAAGEDRDGSAAEGCGAEATVEPPAPATVEADGPLEDVGMSASVGSFVGPTPVTGAAGGSPVTGGRGLRETGGDDVLGELTTRGAPDTDTLIHGADTVMPGTGTLTPDTDTLVEDAPAS